MKSLSLAFLLLFPLMEVPAQDKKPEALPLRQALPVLEYTQKYTLSCEAASTSVVLKYLGLNIEEDEVLAALPYDTTPKTVDARGNITWGDPEKAFVGAYDGVYLKTGYGIYAAPLAKALENRFPVKAAAGSALKLEDLCRAAAQGLPTVVWVPTRFEHVKPQTWKTPGGKTITWIEHEHAMVFRGYDSQEGVVYLMDVHYGKYQTRTTAEFLRGWGYLGNQAVFITQK